MMTQIYEMERSTKIITPNMTFKTRRKKRIIVATSGFSLNNKCALCVVVFVTVFFQLVMCSLVSGSQVTSINSTEAPLPTVATLPPSSPRKPLSQKSKEIMKPHQRPGGVVKLTGPARDLRVLPITVDGRDTLQLNVSFLPPKGGRIPHAYSIVVKVFEKEGCETRDCHYDTTNATAPHLIPAFMSTIVDDECTIRPSCSYNIALTAHPSSGNYTSTVTTNITIPECVEHLCSCLGPSGLLAPYINATAFNNNTIYVFWGYNSSTTVDISIIQYYKVGFRKASGMPWDVLDHESDVLSENKTFFSHVIRRNMTPHLNYRVTVHPVNDKNCEGPMASVNVSLPGEVVVDIKAQEKKMPALEFWALCAIIMLGFLVLFVMMRFRPRCGIKKVLQRRAANSRTGGTDALHQQTAWPPSYLHGNEAPLYHPSCTIPRHPFPPRPLSAVTVDTGVVRDSETVAKAAKDDPGTGLRQNH